MNERNKSYDLELMIAKFLRYGVIFCGVLILIGWLMNLEWDANPFYIYQDYDPMPLVDLLLLYLKNKNIGGLLAYAGLTLLVCLPVLRVFLTAILFVKQKENALAMIAFVVFALLIVSFLLGMTFE